MSTAPQARRIPDLRGCAAQLASARAYLLDAIDYAELGAHEAGRKMQLRCAEECRAIARELDPGEGR